MFKIGEALPNFTFHVADQPPRSLQDYLGQQLVLFFYPKDLTSGCTKEAIGFSEALSDFSAINTVVLGISPDSFETHKKFTLKHNLTVPLVSDVDKEIIEACGLWIEKKLYGRTYMGVERTTLLIDPSGKLKQVWRKVKVKGHVEEVLNEAKQV